MGTEEIAKEQLEPPQVDRFVTPFAGWEQKKLRKSNWNLYVGFDLADDRCVGTEEIAKEQLELKDWKQHDDGTEQTMDECLTSQWATYTRPLSVFSAADLAHFYVVFEVVFADTSAVTVEIRNVRYAPD